MHKLVRKQPRFRTLRQRKWLTFFVGCGLVVNGCATKRTVVSECPRPSIEQQADLEVWLYNESDRPAAVWAAKVLGKIYAEELEEKRSER